MVGIETKGNEGFGGGDGTKERYSCHAFYTCHGAMALPRHSQVLMGAVAMPRYLLEPPKYLLSFAIGLGYVAPPFNCHLLRSARSFHFRVGLLARPLSCRFRL
ncbi:hypothetical protein Pyn_28982 [Prunus yedoensis var. nudiflora]|uniref:Uncharacterized protein n=1 Tax=Prunus yedoensis var. nudiflora TaxID=2094558 RepID=A0A314Z8B6_PRUYE|nr:hypothetical protein Pyn_28982 [Prunus yedoensis var. nudiflora]